MSSVTVNEPVLTITPEHEVAISRVVAAMQAEPDYPFTLDTLAEIANFSPYHFARLFRSLIGIPPGEFLTALRYERAKQLLLTTNLSVTDICFEVGYDSLGTFSSRFKRLIGLSPAGFRALPAVMEAFAVADLPPIPTVFPDLGIPARIQGRVISPPGVSGDWHVYVGIFPASIARGNPVSGVRIGLNEGFALQHVPRGNFRLLSAAVPVDAPPTAHLLPQATMMVASYPDVISIETGHEQYDIPLMLRPPSPLEPPVLIALPALTLPAVFALPPARNRDLLMLATATQD